MDFFDAVKKRRSTRQFTPTSVPDAVIEKALGAALIAPNSSNMQPWHFFWVKSPEKKDALVKACLSQSAARTANHLVVAVAHIDTWKRNRDELIAIMKKNGPVEKYVLDYYYKIVPLMYVQDPLGLLGIFKWLLFNTMGLFKPTPRGPISRSGIFQVVTKTTALACENFMLAIAAQGFASCPMEGFDECRVKKILGLGRNSHVVMVLAVGEADSQGLMIPQYRLDISRTLTRI